MIISLLQHAIIQSNGVSAIERGEGKLTKQLGSQSRNPLGPFKSCHRTANRLLHPPRSQRTTIIHESRELANGLDDPSSRNNQPQMGLSLVLLWSEWKMARLFAHTSEETLQMLSESGLLMLPNTLLAYYSPISILMDMILNLCVRCVRPSTIKWMKTWLAFPSSGCPSWTTRLHQWSGSGIVIKQHWSLLRTFVWSTPSCLELRTGKTWQLHLYLRSFLLREVDAPRRSRRLLPERQLIWYIPHKWCASWGKDLRVLSSIKTGFEDTDDHTGCL